MRGALAVAWLVTGIFAGPGLLRAAYVPKKASELWALRPLSTASVPQEFKDLPNPVDAFIARSCREKGLVLADPANPAAWLRRVTFDLIGLAPTEAEQDEFLKDPSAEGKRKVVQRLLASEQHGVRYGRHWLDVLRYADFDENMPVTPGIHFWRDWVIYAVNSDLPYDEFVRAQLTGNRAASRRTVSPEGHLSHVPPRPEDRFAQGFLARGAASVADTDQMLAFSAVETVSTAFLGLTVGCAKCHDHFFDPIRQADFYSMKAIFDPMVIRQVELATPEQVYSHGGEVTAHAARQNAIVTEMRAFIAPFHNKLYEERLSELPTDAQAAIRKPEKLRSVSEQKIADDYHPILRIDPPKLKAIMPPDVARKYDGYLKQLTDLKAPEPLPAYWTVEDDAKRSAEKRYVLTTGDPARPKLSQEVQPGLPLVTAAPEFREGRRETFGDWLTAPGNPLFARVAVNRIWQWHFGTALHPSLNDFGSLGGAPYRPELLDFLAAEFIRHKYSMKWLHTLIVTSETYARSTRARPEMEAANHWIDPENHLYWKFPLNRLDAESIRDSLLQVAGRLDTRLGGKSFQVQTNDPGTRRTAFMQRGYRSFQEVMPAYLQTFDAEDGRNVCPRRHQTVTATQALFLMNDPLVDQVSRHLASRLGAAGESDPVNAVRAGYRMALGRSPTADEEHRASPHLVGTDPSRWKDFAWALLNLDEFIYLR